MAHYLVASTGITKPKDTFFADDPQVTEIEKALKANRHRHFFARTTKTKLACRKEDKRLRDALQQRLIDLATKPDESIIAENLALIQKLEADRANYLSEKWEKRVRQEQTELFGTIEPEQQTFALRVDINKAKRDKIDSDIRHCRARIDAERTKAKNNAFTKEAQKLALWDPYDQNATSGFFDPEWMFGINAGFDIVIGNPPYIQLQNNGGELADLYKDRGFETYERTGDIYALFYERAHQLLKSDALLCFITSNKWMRSGYGESLRKFFAEKTIPQVLIDFAGQKIFEAATVDTNILITRNSVDPSTGCEREPAPCLAVVANENCRQQLSVFVQQNAVVQSFDSAESWVILSPLERSIKGKIERVGTPLKMWDINIYRGILTGYNEAFIIDEAKRLELIAQDPMSAEIIRPILCGRDIKRYGYNWAGRYLIATHNGILEKGIPKINITKYPAVKKHLDSHWKHIEVRADQGDTPYHLRSCAYMEDFSKPKIVWGNLALSAQFAAAPSGMFVNAPCPMIVPFNGYLLAVLNSKLGDWYIRHLGVTRSGGYFEYKPMFIEQLPVPQAQSVKAQRLTILAANPTKENQSEIDRIVFELYGLTREESEYLDNQSLRV